MTCKQEVSAQEDLLPIVSNLFNPFTLEDDEKSADAAVEVIFTCVKMTRWLEDYKSERPTIYCIGQPQVFV